MEVPQSDKFLEEAANLIDELEHSLMQLELESDNSSHVESIFRVMHTIKGGANMFEFFEIGEFTHRVENLYDAIRAGNLNVEKVTIELTFNAIDLINKLLENGGLPSENEKAEIENIYGRIDTILNAGTANSNSNVKNATKATYWIKFKPHSDYFNVPSSPVLLLIDEVCNLGNFQVFASIESIPPIDKLDPLRSYLSWDIFLATEAPQDDVRAIFIFVEDQCDITIDKIADQDVINKQYDVKDYLKPKVPSNPLLKDDKEKKKDNQSSTRVSMDKIDSLMNWVSELVVLQATLKNISMGTDVARLGEIAESIEVVTENLREISFGMSLVPLSSIFIRFKRLVRDLSNKLDKQINFISEGTDTEVDKKIIEELMDPMLHILRNCIDHGIEHAKDRTAKNKPEKGTITLDSWYSGSNIIIEIRDDGKGIDEDLILQKGIEKGILEKNINYEKAEILEVLFHPGFSTSETITDISGRGVGMDVVKRNIQSLKGDVTIISQKDIGTTFRITLPLTLSIIDGLLTEVNDTLFVIPLSVVGQCYRVGLDELEVDSMVNKTIQIEGELFKSLNLIKLFGDSTSNTPPNERATFIELLNDKNNSGIAVNRIVQQGQFVVKPVSKMYKDQKYLSGATILGDGSLALILDTDKLFNYFEEKSYQIS